MPTPQINSAPPPPPPELLQVDPPVRAGTSAPPPPPPELLEQGAPPPPPELVDPEYAAVRQTIDRPIASSFTDSNVVGTEKFTDKELAAIAKHHGVDEEALRYIAPMQGASMEKEREGDVPQYLLGAAGRVGFGIPQFLGKKMVDDENLRSALDDVRNLADRKRSWAETLAEGAVPITAGAKTVAGARRLAPAALEGMAQGATAGLAGSNEGEELESAATGAAVGTGLGAGAHGLGKYFEGRKLAAEVEPEKVPLGEAGFLTSRQEDITSGAERVMQQRAPAEELLGKEVHSVLQKAVAGAEDKHGFGLSAGLSPEDARKFNEATLSEKRLAALTNPGTDTGAAVSEAARQAGVDPHQYISDVVISKRLGEFEDFLAGERASWRGSTPAETFARVAKEEGPEYLQGAYERYKWVSAAKAYIKRAGLAELPAKEAGALGRAADFFSDAQFVAQRVDDVHGLDTRRILADLDESRARLTYTMHDTNQKLDKILYKAGRKLGVGKDAFPKIVAASESGDLSGLTPNEKVFHDLVVEKLSDIAQIANLQGLEIKPLRNTLPVLIARPHEVPFRFKQQKELVLQQASDLLGQEVRSLADLDEKQIRRLISRSQDVKDLVRGLHVVLPESIRDLKVTGLELEAAYRAATDLRRVNPRLETIAAATATDTVPAFLRERNLYHLYQRYALNTFRHLEMRKPLADLRARIKVLQAAGDYQSAGYFTKLIQDTTGVRKGTVGEVTNRWTNDLRQWAERKGQENPSRKDFYEMVALLPGNLSQSIYNIYPNFMGMNPKAILYQITQPWVKTAPELGGTYGYTAVLRGAMSAFGNWGALTREIRERGYAPQEFSVESIRALEEGIRDTWGYQLAAAPLRATAGLAMAIYQKADLFNRVITLGAAKAMARDLVKGSKAATHSLTKLPSSVQRAARKAMEDGDQEALASVLSSHLIQATQYHYNRATMSEAGRTMGSLFAMFSKWPTSTWGEISSDFRTRGAKAIPRQAEKFLAPLMLLGAGNYLLRAGIQGKGAGDVAEELSGLTGGELPDTLAREQNPLEKKILGAKGLMGASPLSSLNQLKPDEMFSPPAMDILFAQTLMPLLQGDPEAMSKGLWRSIEQIGPGYFAWRMAFEDIPIYKGESPPPAREQLRDFLKQTTNEITGD